MRRYLLLFVITLVAAAVLGRLARRSPSEASIARTSAPAVAAIILVVEDGRVLPAGVAVPKEYAVDLTVENRGAAPIRFTLAGYEDRVSNPALLPGTSWTIRFTADRPGEDFAWLVDGRPAGRMAVQGSHLVEGHR